jgi:hypothetical protein
LTAKSPFLPWFSPVSRPSEGVDRKVSKFKIRLAIANATFYAI